MKRKQFEQRAPRANRRRGFTLIEVILALAIFMLGALAIVRIFPPALAAVQRSGSQTAGTRLATSTLEKMNGRVASSAVSSVPDAIYFPDPTFAGTFNGTINHNQSLPRDSRLAGNGNTANDSALKMGASLTDSGSFIDGERQKVLRFDVGNTPANLTDDILGVLTNFPYGSSPSIAIEDTVEGVRIRDVGLPGTPKYVFDFTNSTLGSTGASWKNASDSMYPVGTAADGCTYYISYQWIEANAVNTVHGVEDEPYVFPVPSAVGADALKTALSDRIVNVNTADYPRSVVTGEVKVRMVRKMGSATPVSAGDEFRGFSQIPSSLGINAGDTVRLSYQVADWRTIIVDQVPVSNSVALPTRGLDSETPDSQIYALLYSAPDSSGLSRNAPRRGDYSQGANTTLAIEPDKLPDSSVNPNRTRGGGNETNRVVFKNNGAATPDDNKGLAGLTVPRARIAYRPQDGWGAQATVAARTYVPFLGFNPPAKFESDGYGYVAEPWRQYSWTTGSSNLYLPPGDAGKTIVVTFEYFEGSTYHVAKDRIVTVSDDLQDVSNAKSGFIGGGGKVSVAELTDLSGLDSPNVTSILSVRGLSVQARAVWADNQGRYSQTVVTDYRKSS